MRFQSRNSLVLCLERSTIGEGVIEGQNQSEQIGEAEEMGLNFSHLHLFLRVDDAFALLLNEILIVSLPGVDDNRVK